MYFGSKTSSTSTTITYDTNRYSGDTGDTSITLPSVSVGTGRGFRVGGPNYDTGSLLLPSTGTYRYYVQTASKGSNPSSTSDANLTITTTTGYVASNDNTSYSNSSSSSWTGGKEASGGTSLGWAGDYTYLWGTYGRIS